MRIISRLGRKSAAPFTTPPSSEWSREARFSVAKPAAQVLDRIIRVDITHDDLRTTANGGVVTDANAQDVRFEALDAVTWAWDKAYYNASTGRLVAHVRLGTTSANQRRDGRMLVGRAGQTEQNMAGTWSGAIAAWFGADGTNREGTSTRDLTTSGVTADATDPWVGIYDGADDHMSHADGSFFNGLAEFTIEVFIRPDAIGSDRRIIAQGPHNTNDRLHGVLLRYDDAGFQGGADDCITASFHVRDGSSVDWAMRYESAAGVQTTSWQHVVWTWKSGELPKLYVNGVLDVPSWVGSIKVSDGTKQQDVPISGTVQLPSGTFEVGGLTTNPWDGAIAFVGIYPHAFTAEEAKDRAWSWLHPSRLYGVSAFGNVVGTSDPVPVVAMPVETTLAPSSGTSVNVVSAAVDDGTPTLQSVGTAQGALASASVNGNNVNLTAGSSEGLGWVDFTLSDGTTSTSRVWATVSGSGSGSPEYPDPLRVVTVSTYNELSSALVNAQPGDHIVLTNGTYSGQRLVVNVSGTAQNPIVIRAQNLLGASVPGTFVLQGSNLIIWGFDCSNQSSTLEIAGTDNVVRRCRFNAFGSHIRLKTGQGGKILYCEFTCPSKDALSPDTRIIGSQTDSNERHTDAEIGWCWFHDMPFKTSNYSDRARAAIQIGDSPGDAAFTAGFYIHHCLFENTGDNELSFKARGNLVEFCTGIGDKFQFRVRQGGDNEFVGCWLENARAFELMGADNTVRWCKAIGSPFNVWAGQVEADNTTSNKIPRALRTTLIGCDGSVVVGEYYSSRPDQTLEAKDTVIKGHVGTITLKRETNTQQFSEAGETPITPLKLTSAEVGPFA